MNFPPADATQFASFQRHNVSSSVVSASRTLTEQDNGKTLDLTATGIALTVPPGLPVQFRCTVLLTGTDTIVAGAGVTLNGATTTLSRSLSSQGAIDIISRSTQNAFVVSGA